MMRISSLFGLDRMPGEIRLMDITLLDQYRNQGIGSLLMKCLFDEAEGGNQCVSLHVEENNPAMQLYQRLGFVEVGEVTFYKLMHWHASPQQPKRSETIRAVNKQAKNITEANVVLDEML